MIRPYESVLLGAGPAPDRLADYQREAVLFRRALRVLRWASRQPGQPAPKPREQATAARQASALLQEIVP